MNCRSSSQPSRSPSSLTPTAATTATTMPYREAPMHWAPSVFSHGCSDNDEQGMCNTASSLWFAPNNYNNNQYWQPSIGKESNETFMSFDNGDQSVMPTYSSPPLSMDASVTSMSTAHLSPDFAYLSPPEYNLQHSEHSSPVSRQTTPTSAGLSAPYAPPSLPTSQSVSSSSEKGSKRKATSPSNWRSPPPSNSAASPDSKPHPRRNHNLIERRYRTRLNQSIAALASRLPASQQDLGSVEGDGDQAGSADDSAVPAKQKGKIDVLRDVAAYIDSLHARAAWLEREIMLQRERKA